MSLSLPLQAAVVALAIALVKYLLNVLFPPSPLHNLRGPPAKSWLRGDMDQLFHPQGWDFHLKDIVSFGTAVRLKGFLGEDVLYLTDPAALRSILVKDHGDIFDEPPMIIERNKLLWGHGLLSSTGAAHKRQRRVINAVFSTSRMREVIPIFYSVTHKLEDSLVNLLQNGPRELDMLIWMSRTSLELIGRAGIGKSFDTLAETSPPDEYMMAAKQLIPLSFPLQGFMRAIPRIVKLGSPRILGFLAGIAPYQNIRKLKEIIYFLYETNEGIFRKRVQDLAEEKPPLDSVAGEGRDVVSVLIKENRRAADGDKLSDEELISQMGTLIFAGHDTTSVALSRILHVLALDPERQETLRREVTEACAQPGGDLSYDALSALPYLDAVCKETLRLYSPVTQLHRTPRKAAVIPLSRPVIGEDDSVIDRLTVNAGTMVVVGAAAVNRDRAIWGPDADEWIPERWLEPLPTSVAEAHLPAVYSNLMTFMGGGRSCIGFKFAETEIKVVLSILLSRLRFEPSEKNIVWNMYNFATPTVGGSGSPSLPMKVSLIA